MPKRIATFAALKTLAALLLGSGLAAAYAAEAPDNVEAEIAEAVQSCKDLDGKPNADAVLSTKDVNGDGGEDWIADYSKLSCQGGINQMCDDEGCVLQIYLWNGADGLEPRFRRGGEELQILKAPRAASAATWSWPDRLATSRAAPPAT